MKLAAISVFLCSVTATMARAEELDILFLDGDIPARAPASAYPKEFDSKFEAQAPLDREPASLPRADRLAKSKSLLPAEMLDGFEVRSIAPPERKGEKPVVNTFRVERNRVGYYLRFRNSSGSQSEVTLSNESFANLRRRASLIPSQSVNLKTCKGAMQLIEKTKNGERLATYCLNAHTKPAEALRAVGNLLVTWVR